VDATISAESTVEAQSIASELRERPANFVVLTPRGGDAFSLRHRVLVPLFHDEGGQLVLNEGQPAFLEYYDRIGLTYLRLSVSLGEDVTLGPVGAPADLFLAIRLQGDEAGGVDWSAAPALFDPQGMTGFELFYDASALIVDDSSEEEAGDNEEAPEDVDLIEAVTDAIRDKLVSTWDGISGGLASIGWGSGGAIDTISDTLNRANGGS
jgi:hypothetical protein